MFSLILNINYYYVPVKNGRSGEIRTPGPLVPNQMRYQAALHSDAAVFMSLTNINQVHIEAQIHHSRPRTGNSSFAAFPIPVPLAVPAFSSRTYFAPAVDRRGVRLSAGTSGIAVTSPPASSKNSMSSGIRVFFIQKLRRAVFWNTNSMPRSGGILSTCISP